MGTVSNVSRDIGLGFDGSIIAGICLTLNLKTLPNTLLILGDIRP